MHKINIWKHRGIYKPQPLSDSVKALGLDPVDIHEFLYPPKEEKWKPPPDDPRFQHWAEEVPDTEQPDYHEETLYQLSNTVRLSEGIQQACLLTKTQTFDGLPTQIQELVGKASIRNQDLLVQKAIMQSQVWDPMKESLPKHKDLENLKYPFKKEFGITKARSSNILLNNLIRLAQGLVGQYPSLLTDRKLIFNPTFETVYRYKEFQIRVSGEYECLMLGKRPLQPFGDEELVDQSVHHKIPDMFPILPTIDLLPFNRYNIREHGVLKDTVREGAASSPITLFRTVNVSWKPEFKQAYNMMMCFAIAAQEARRIYGPDVKTLPKPITVQNINMDWTTLNFLCFQLNTLNLQSDDGIKNFAWCDHDNRMFVKNYPKPWRPEEMYKHYRYTDYTPEVFEKFLAMFLTGTSKVQKNT